MMHPPAWYPIAALARDNLAVVLLLATGGEAIGFKRTHKRARRIAVRCIPQGAGSVDHLAFEDIGWYVPREDGRADELPRWGWPSHFRPLDRKRYPDPLPPPARLLEARAWQTPPPAPSMPEAADDLDWPAPHSEPGKISREEAKVRLFRGLRTERSRNTTVGRSRGGDIDSVLRVLLRARGKLEYEHPESASTLPAIAEPWQATRRDHGDWLIALGWFAQLSVREQEIVRYRSLTPPYSFRQIGEMLKRKVSESTVREAFERALDCVQKIANRARPA